MDVTPQLLHDVEFREAKRGGYNTQDVDEFLERLAVALERQGSGTQDARQRIEAAEARAAEAERRAALAEQSAGESSASEETLRRTLVLAQRTADAAIREAEEEANRVLTAAQTEADRLLAEAHEVSVHAQAAAQDEARQAHEAARAQVLSEMIELEAARDQLRTDVELLERHLAGQRERAQSAVAELQRLLDDPSSLAEVALPEISDVTAPAAYAPPEAVSPEERQEEPVADWEPDDEVWESSDEEESEDPPTQQYDALGESDADDDAYLAELRKAMTDDTPLGPRDDSAESGMFDSTVEAGRSRFGRRR